MEENEKESEEKSRSRHDMPLLNTLSADAINRHHQHHRRNCLLNDEFNKAVLLLPKYTHTNTPSRWKSFDERVPTYYSALPFSRRLKYQQEL